MSVAFDTPEGEFRGRFFFPVAYCSDTLSPAVIIAPPREGSNEFELAIGAILAEHDMVSFVYDPSTASTARFDSSTSASPEEFLRRHFIGMMGAAAYVGAESGIDRNRVAILDLESKIDQVSLLTPLAKWTVFCCEFPNYDLPPERVRNARGTVRYGFDRIEEVAAGTVWDEATVTAFEQAVRNRAITEWPRSVVEWIERERPYQKDGIQSYGAEIAIEEFRTLFYRLDPALRTWLLRSDREARLRMGALQLAQELTPWIGGTTVQ